MRAWKVLAAAGLAKGAAGLLAAVMRPDVLEGANAHGVAHLAQVAAVAICLSAALAVWGEHPVRAAYATCWALGSAAFAHVPLALAGWPDPPVELALWLALPVAVGLPLAVAAPPRLRRRRPGAAALVVVASLCLAAIAASALIVLPRVAPEAAAVYFAVVIAAAAMSTSALRRSHRA
jgi:hypothetical protein